MAVVKITKRFVDALAPAASMQVFYDTDLKGFGLRLMTSGVGAYFVEYRTAGGGRRVDKRRMKLGRVGELTPDEARKQARERLAEVCKGEDPLAERQTRRRELKVSDLIDQWENEDPPGRRSGLPFDMNLLFERYVGRHVARLRPAQTRLQGPRSFALIELPLGIPAFQTVPDILIKDDHGITILDTKWARLDAADRLLQVDQANIYQIMAYGQVYQARRLILLFPYHDGLADAVLPREFLVSGTQVALQIHALRLESLSTVPTALRSLLSVDSSSVAQMPETVD